MEVELKQADYIDYFVTKASNLKGHGLSDVIVEATSHPSLFAFSEILSVPNVLELEGTDYSSFLTLLRIFAHGTWSEYKNIASSLPPLSPDQVLKLKQLTVLSLAETEKVLPYDELMKELDVANVRELEDFLINDCMYVGIVKGKLDQLRRCFEVQFVAGRDLRPGQLGSMIDLLSNWLSTSDSLLVSIQEKIKWADSMNEMHNNHKVEVDAKMEEAKRMLSLKIGRPVVFSLAADGEAGVRNVLKMLRDEFELTMALSGCRSLSEITRDHVVTEWDPPKVLPAARL